MIYTYVILSIYRMCGIGIHAYRYLHMSIFSLVFCPSYCIPVPVPIIYRYGTFGTPDRRNVYRYRYRHSTSRQSSHEHCPNPFSIASRFTLALRPFFLPRYIDLRFKLPTLLFESQTTLTNETKSVDGIHRIDRKTTINQGSLFAMA